MTEREFASLTQLSGKGEQEKAILIAFFFYKKKSTESLTANRLADAFADFGLTRPNPTRLRANLLANRCFARSGKNEIKIALRKLEALELEFPSVQTDSEEIHSNHLILPEQVYSKTRGYIEKIAKQINASYQHNLFDGCALMMRRLMEVLIILAYKHLGRDSEIVDASGAIQGLNFLIKHAIAHKVLGLTKDSETMLDHFRQLGNYSAHAVEYNCKKGDIDPVKLRFRACVEELLYKAGVRT